MSNQDYLDSFFNQFPIPDMSGLHIRPLVSDCCSASMFDEPFNMPGSTKTFGRCSKCYEVSEFTEGDQ